MTASPGQTSPKGRASGASCTSSFNSLPTTGNGVLVYGWCWSSGTPVAGTPVDNQTGNTYTALQTSPNNGGIMAGLWYCPSITAPSGTFTVTIKFTNGSTVEGAIMEVASGATVTPLDGHASNSGSGTNATSGTTATLTQADELVVICGAWPGSGTNISEPLPTGFTRDVQEQDNNTWQAGDGDHKVVSATTAQSAQWNPLTSSGGWTTCIATIKGAAAASDPFPAGYGHPFGATGQAQLQQLLAN